MPDTACPCCERFLVWKMKEKWKCWYCDNSNKSAWRCSKHGSMAPSEEELSEVLGIKLEIEDMRESLLAKKVEAEEEFKSIATEYNTVWEPCLTHPALKELQDIKSSQYERLSQPSGMAGKTSSQAYLDALIASVRALIPKFQDLLYKLAQATGVRVICAPLKSMKRVLEKSLYNYNKDQSKVLDVGRGSAIADDLTMVVAATKWVIANCAVARLKNRFCNLTHLSNRGGYRDMLINIYLGGFVLEIQIHLKVFYAMKTENAKIYNVSRTIERTLYKLDIMSKQEASKELAARLRALTETESYEYLQSPNNNVQLADRGRALTDGSNTIKMSPQADEGTKKQFSFELGRENKIFEPSASLKRILSACKNGLKLLDPKPSFNEWQEFVVYAKAHSGRIECLYGLGYCLKYGCGVTQQAHEAVRVLRLAVAKNYAPAQECLGRCYEKGKGVRSPNLEEAAKLYQLAALQDYAEAQVDLGLCYENGIGVGTDLTEAFRWYYLAAAQKNARGQFRVALCYERGLGVPQDEQEAIRYAMLAADQNYSVAQHYLGCCSEVGIGMPVSNEYAIKWYRLAAEQNNVNGQCCLGVCYERGLGVAADPQEAVKWYRLAAEQKSGEGNYYLGCCYRDGIGVSKDVLASKRHLCLALEQGYDNARLALEAMSSKADG